jgi:hypothetical protein
MLPRLADENRDNRVLAPALRRARAGRPPTQCRRPPSERRERLPQRVPISSIRLKGQRYHCYARPRKIGKKFLRGRVHIPRRHSPSNLASSAATYLRSYWSTDQSRVDEKASGSRQSSQRRRGSAIAPTRLGRGNALGRAVSRLVSQRFTGEAVRALDTLPLAAV